MSAISGKSREMLLLSFLSYLTVFYDKKNKKQIKGLNRLFQEQGADIDLNKFNMIWGPAFHYPPLWRFTRFLIKKIFSDTLFFLVEHKDTINEYTLVIRGTNPVSFYSWLTYDLKVRKKKNWNESDVKQGAVSTGTYAAMENLKTVTPNKGYAGYNKTILDFIDRLLNRTAGKFKLNITGHSLGGVMASTFGLYMRQLYGDRIDVNIYSFAAPTAGDKNYARLSNKQLADRCLRYANKLDVAPLAWNEKTLQTAWALYKGVGPSFIMQLLIKRALKEAHNNEYTQINKHIPLTVPDCDSRLYVYHLVYHHVIAYLVAAGFQEDLIVKIFTYIIEETKAPGFVKKGLKWLVKQMV